MTPPIFEISIACAADLPLIIAPIHRPQGATAIVPYEPRLVTEDMVALRQAALSGIGVCQFPTMVVQEDLATGRLVDILPQWAPRSGIIHAVFPSRRGLLPSVRAMVDFLAEEYAVLAKIN